MSLEQPEEDLRFIFPALSFIRVWDKGSTSHIYNEPLSLLSVLSQISDIVRWWAEQSLVRDGRQISDDDNDDDDDTAPDPGHDMPLTIVKVRPVLRYPCSAISPLRTILTEGSVYSVFPGKCPQVEPPGAPGAPPPADHLWCVSPLASSEPLSPATDGSQPRLSFERNLSPDSEIFRAKSSSHLSSLRQKGTDKGH